MCVDRILYWCPGGYAQVGFYIGVCVGMHKWDFTLGFESGICVGSDFALLSKVGVCIGGILHWCSRGSVYVVPSFALMLSTC